ncbi:hypothetical protein ACQEUU_37160 [Nonomuraea sp. CA-218870]|uniref:hypothetical protein n=1 Tax=Nonomuraea sp. CA-218870 TaxID=3239998 RepID=UPI003D8CA90A
MPNTSDTQHPEPVVPLPGEDFADWAASLSDAQRGRVTSAERAERLIESARHQRQRERELADRFGWR